MQFVVLAEKNNNNNPANMHKLQLTLETPSVNIKQISPYRKHLRINDRAFYLKKKKSTLKLRHTITRY